MCPSPKYMFNTRVLIKLTNQITKAISISKTELYRKKLNECWVFPNVVELIIDLQETSSDFLRISIIMYFIKLFW